MATLKASEQGKRRIQQARNDKGWTVDDPRWLVEASRILEPARNWELNSQQFTNGVSEGTWRAFLYRTRGINTEVFKAYCQVLELSWEEVRESTETSGINQDTAEATSAIAIDCLNQLERESKVRCIERWQAAGVSESEAIELADDSSIGTPPPHIQPCAEKLILLIGELGAGKSLIGERLFQIAIKQAKENANAPIPVYLEAKKVVGHLQEAVEAAAIGIGNPQIQGATVIIDGADEAGTGLASQLLTEARLLKAWQKTKVVITSRPIPTFEQVEEAVPVPLLSDDDAYTLVERFAQQPISTFTASQWPQAVQDAIHRPLFAVLLGIYLHEVGMTVPKSIGELLSSLVERALQRQRTDIDKANHLLQKLAALSIEYGGGAVFAGDVASSAELQPLINSRLVVERGRAIGFPLPILTQWFAAQSLVTGNPEPEDLISDFEQLERWRYPLIIAIATFGDNEVSRLLRPIAENHPAFAAEIVKEGLATWFRNVALPPPLESGRRIRIAMQAWVKGIGSLAQLIAPVREDGTLPPIGVHTDGGRLSTAWYDGSDDLKDVVKLLASKLPDFLGVGTCPALTSLPDWTEFRSTPTVNHSAWAWRSTIEELVPALSQILQHRALPINEGFLVHEAIWQAAQAVLSVIQGGSSGYRPIPLDKLEECLSKLPRNIYQSFGSYKLLHRHDLNQLIREVNRLREAGERELCPPWPKPEHEWTGGRLWKYYTVEQMRSHAETVYKGALDAYQQLVKTWFPKFAFRLETEVLLPARLVGIVTPPQPNQELKSAPVLKWCFEVLPEGEQSTVDFRLADQNLWDYIAALNDHLRSRRPEAVTWISSTTIHVSNLDVFHPNSATKLAYTWLWDDLKRVSWVDGFLGSPPQ
jgi:hypothetical protein